jgi:hypothetical protein
VGRAGALRFAGVVGSIETPFVEVRNNAAIAKFERRTVSELGGELGRKLEFAMTSAPENARRSKCGDDVFDPLPHTQLSSKPADSTPRRLSDNRV